MNASYIRDLSFPCEQSGFCQHHLAISTLEEAQHIVRSERERMAGFTHSLWCQEKDHAFSELDPNKVVIAVRVGNEDDYSTTSKTVCGPCAAEKGWTRPSEVRELDG